jgi:hypothetical protein
MPPTSSRHVSGLPHVGLKASGALGRVRKTDSGTAFIASTISVVKPLLLVLQIIHPCYPLCASPESHQTVAAQNFGGHQVITQWGDRILFQISGRLQERGCIEEEPSSKRRFLADDAVVPLPA